ncbi:hypothetical protein [Sphingomonas parva]|uniref:hypothetical protein n=1 Tax=Sphingomonas parva TaxID=2555898 RepID=UPI0014322162|nr:hypothetical protein [Sphingomonas parva]
MSPISDNDLADIEAIAATGRPIPGLIVRSIILRLREAEAAAKLPEEEPRPILA